MGFEKKIVFCNKNFQQTLNKLKNFGSISVKDSKIIVKASSASQQQKSGSNISKRYDITLFNRIESFT